MMKTVYILITTFGAYEDFTTEVVGVTDDKATSHAFLQMGVFQDTSHEVEIATLNVLDGKLRERIDQWLDPAQNPLCTCGHRLLHHRLRGKNVGLGSCKHNLASRRHDTHKCKGFTLAKEQPKIEF
jgi:hypothetical protein